MPDLHDIDNDRHIAAFTLGCLRGTVTRPDFPLQVDHVEHGMDDEGLYDNHFIIVTHSGRRIRVTVEPEENA